MPRKAKIEDTENTKEISQQGLIYATGKRKTAVASVFLHMEKGDFLLNEKPIDDYFLTEKERMKWVKPFHVNGFSHPEAQFSATLKVHGSGKSAQLDAVALAFSRALAKMKEEYRQILRKQGLLTRDPRMVERKKYYLRKARKAPQYSKR